MRPSLPVLSVLLLLAQPAIANVCLDGADGLKYQGKTVRILALERSKLPNFYARALEFENATGAKVEITEASIGTWPSAVVGDTGSVTGGSGPHLFDGYVIKGNWMADLCEVKAIADLSEFIREGTRWTDLDWPDITDFVRKSVCTYQDRVYSIPLDADYMVTAVRGDLLSTSASPLGVGGPAASPATWRQFVEFAEAAHGKDLNGDGVPDYGACFAKGAGGARYTHFSVFGPLWAIVAPHVQTKGTSTGAFFDSESLEPLMAKSPEAFNDALDLFRRLNAVAPPGKYPALNAKKDFQSGRCATWISLPGFVFGVQDTGGVKVKNATRAPGATMLRIKSPGVECKDPATCPLAERDGALLITRAPFFATSGIALSVSAYARNVSQQIVFDLFNYMASRGQSSVDTALRSSFSDPFRKSHLGDTAQAYLVAKNGWKAADAKQYLETTSWALNHPNAALDLRVPGQNSYMAAALNGAEHFVHFNNVSVGDAAKQIAESWSKIPSAIFQGSTATAAKFKMLDMYRAQLGLPAQERLAAGVIISLTSDDTGVVIGLSIVGGVLGSVILVFLAVMAVRRARALLKAEREKKQQQKSRLHAAIQTTKQLNFPFNLIRSADFIDAGKMVRHEVLRDQGKLIVIDELNQAYSFATEHPIVFFSHQWTAFGEPDHTNKQFEMMVTSLREVCEQKKWDLDSVVVWADYSSIPQVHRGLQGLAIHSLAAYASAAAAFVVVTPAVPHKDLPGQVCDEDTYRTRMWCRAEQLCHSLRNGVGNMWVANDSACVPMAKDWFNAAALFVFQGEATCCRLKHAKQRRCDREELMLPILGLFGELYAGKDSDTEKKALWEQVKTQKEDMFPSEFSFIVDKAKKGTVNDMRGLFGELVGMMEELINTDADIREHLLGSSSQGRIDMFRRQNTRGGLVHGGPVHGGPLVHGGPVHGGPVHGGGAPPAAVDHDGDRGMTVVVPVNDEAKDGEVTI